MNLRTAESVSPKHPDKICDQISDSILDAALRQDPNSRVAVETVGGHKLLVVMGEITSRAKVNYEQIARRFVDDSYEVKVKIVHQSPEIAQGVDIGGAGDQGIMVGYATSETENLIPLEVDLSRSLNRYLFSKFPYDGKTQVTTSDGKIVAVVASFQNVLRAQLENEVRDWLKEQPIKPVLKVFTNPAGDWDIGGFDSDTGLTGRKIAVDSYGPRIPIGGGAFSGKDATKVDRSAAYMARKVAVDYLRKRDAKETFCYLAYAIGVSEPVEAVVLVDGEEEAVRGYDLTPKGIIDFLQLQLPQFEETAKYGHFGNAFSWDK
ncbi:MAG TPA: methionine adenosyltransferase domain-containing protein [Patescibacteria group bacterium]|jgi:S-adenosylmethionine synthetase|nr:methionine adenosyltransferase domain-containing protein [Patescibacteria group bacterium]